MKRLTEYSVASGLRIACRLATCPTSRWPSSVKATTDGVVRAPSALTITSAWPPSIVAATTEFVVPRSIPTALAISGSLSPRRRVPALTKQAGKPRRGRLTWPTHRLPQTTCAKHFFMDADARSLPDGWRRRRGGRQGAMPAMTVGVLAAHDDAKHLAERLTD